MEGKFVKIVVVVEEKNLLGGGTKIHVKNDTRHGITKLEGHHE